MITAIEIENFKAFGERQRIELRPITLLFGPNSGGKSSVTHALHYLREVLCEGNLDAHRTWSGGEVLDLGGIRNFVHARKPGTVIRLKAEFDVTLQQLPFYAEGGVTLAASQTNTPDTRSNDLLESRIRTAAVEVEISSDNGGHLRAWRTWINGNPIGLVRFDQLKPHAEFTEINWDHSILREDTVDRRAAEAAMIRAIIHGEHADASPDSHPTGVDGVSSEADADPGILKCLCSLLHLECMPDSVIHFRLPPGVLYGTDHPLPVVLAQAPDARTAEANDVEQMLADTLSLLLLGPMHVLKGLLADLRYVGPLRIMPPRNAETPDRHGGSRWPSGLQAWERLARDEARDADRVDSSTSLIDEASKWLESQDRLDTGYRLEREEFKRVPKAFTLMIRKGDYVDLADDVADAIRLLPVHSQVVLRDVGRNITLQPQDVGVGLSQIVPVIVALLDPGGPLVALEQPELHLHPRQQTALGDALIDGMSAAPNRVLLVETHSEHVILRLLRRIRESTSGEASRETTLRPEQVSVAYVQPEGTNSIVTAIPVSPEGDFTRTWPNGFFAERVQELL